MQARSVVNGDGDDFHVCETAQDGLANVRWLSMCQWSSVWKRLLLRPDKLGMHGADPGLNRPNR